MSVVIKPGTMVGYNSSYKPKPTPEFLKDLIPIKEVETPIRRYTAKLDTSSCRLLRGFLDIIQCIPYSKSQVYKNLCMWIWCILGKYETIKYNNHLGGESGGNAKYVNMDCMKEDGTKDVIFAKFEIPSVQSDSMIADNANGYILNRIISSLQPSPLRAYFMEYIDSCATIVHKSRFDSLTFELEELDPKFCESPNTFICRYGSDAFIQEANVSFNRHIQGIGNLRDYVVSIVNDGFQSQDVTRLSVMLRNFFRALQKVGQASGFCHNDAHLGNVLVRGQADDPSTHQLVVIDYGRALFSPSLLPNQTQANLMISLEVLKHDVGKVCSRNPNYQTTYQEYMKTLPQMEYIGLGCILDDDIANTQETQFMLKHTFLFDIATISMGIVYMLRKLSKLGKQGAHICADLIVHMDDDLVSVKTPSEILSVARSYPAQSIGDKALERALLPGIYWYSFFIDVLYNSADLALKNKAQLGITDQSDIDFYVALQQCIARPTPDLYRVDMEKLLEIDVMHVYFQVIGMPGILVGILDTYMKRDQANILSTLNMYTLQGGRRKRSPIRSAKSKSQKSQKSSKHGHSVRSQSQAHPEIRKVSESYFKGYLGDYMVGGADKNSVYNTILASVETLNRKDKNIRPKPKRYNINELRRILSL